MPILVLQTLAVESRATRGATEEEAAELDFSRYTGSVYLSDVDTAETIRLLAHKVGSDVERAYARSDLLERRRALMQRWSQHVVGQESAVVVFPSAESGKR